MKSYCSLTGDVRHGIELPIQMVTEESSLNSSMSFFSLSADNLAPGSYEVEAVTQKWPLLLALPLSEGHPSFLFASVKR